MARRRSVRLLSLPEVARQSGLTLSALNYYVNLGLLPVADRRGNRRLFAARDIRERLEAIRRLRREGYPLRVIRRQLERGGDGA